jgi:hypothetical protein
LLLLLLFSASSWVADYYSLVPFVGDDLQWGRSFGRVQFCRRRPGAED